jgi:hypothetical protein
MSSNDPEGQKPSSSTQSDPKTLRKHTWNEWWQAAKVRRALYNCKETVGSVILTPLQTINKDDFKNIERVPCARQSLVYGIAGGTAIGCTRYLTSSKLPHYFLSEIDPNLIGILDPFVASNWAVASFVLISAASW